MSRKTIVALYDTPAEAQAARQSLIAAGFDEMNLDITADGGFGGSMEGHGGVVAMIMGWGVPESEAHAYAEGLRQGGALLTASFASDDAVSRASTLLRSNTQAPSTTGPAERTADGAGLGAGAAAMRDANREAQADRTPSAGTQGAEALKADIDRADRGTIDRGRLP
jgi:hypothetical protein